MHEVESPSAQSSLSCPQCGVAWTAGHSSCNSCTFSAESLRLYSPGLVAKYLVPATAVVLVWLVSRNLKKIGRKQEAAKVFWLGLGGFFLTLVAASWIPTEASLLVPGLFSFYSIATAVLLSALYTREFDKWVQTGAESLDSSKYYVLGIFLLIVLLILQVVMAFVFGGLEMNPEFFESFE